MPKLVKLFLDKQMMKKQQIEADKKFAMIMIINESIMKGEKKH